jgi:hypothetical protein
LPVTFAADITARIADLAPMDQLRAWTVIQTLIEASAQGRLASTRIAFYQVLASSAATETMLTRSRRAEILGDPQDVPRQN